MPPKKKRRKAHKMKKPKESWRQLATRYIDKLLSCLPEKDCKKEQGHSCLQPCQTLWQAVNRWRWRQIWQATHQPSRTLTALRVHSHCKSLEEHQKLRNPQKLLLIYTLWRLPNCYQSARSKCFITLHSGAKIEIHILSLPEIHSTRSREGYDFPWAV